MDKRSGKVRMLALVAPQRLGGALAAVPTWKELGVDAVFELWRGLAGPRGMSRARIQFWDDALGKMAASAEWKKQLAQFDMEDVHRDSGDTARYRQAQQEQVKGVLTELGLAR